MEVMGLLHATDVAMQVIKEQGSGHLVSISSVAGRKSGPFGDAYCVRDQVRRGYAISITLRQELVKDNVR
jgi:NADP-dependent 3-hydroxy acid dehydrogenase YdfG